MIRKRYKSVFAEFVNGELIRLVGLSKGNDYEEIIKQALDFYKLLNINTTIKFEIENVIMYLTPKKSKIDLIREFEEEYFLSTGILVE